jgi:hypothetical protein
MNHRYMNKRFIPPTFVISHLCESMRLRLGRDMFMIVCIEFAYEKHKPLNNNKLLDLE